MPRFALICLILLFAGLPVAASASTKAIWGPTKLPDGSSAFPVYEELGVDVLEMQIPWFRVAPTKPTDPRNPDDPAYRWPANVDEAVREARAHGFQVLLLARGTPPWANGGRSQNFAPKDPDDYADYLTAAARRYRSVHRWMVWGETNFPNEANFAPMPSGSPIGPRRYARLLDRAYAALKRASRRNVVIGGNTFTSGAVTPAEFVRFMRLPNGKPPRLDQYGHNPYSQRFPDLKGPPAPEGFRDIADVDTLAREVDRAFPGKPKLWLAEFTISSDHTNSAFSFFVSREEQARWVTAAYAIARKQYVAGLGWFNLHDEPASMANGLTTGLMTYEGERKPAFEAYKRAR